MKNDTFDYYYLPLFDGDEDYEITLTPISGNPDLVISLNPNNKFPDRENNNYISEEEFTTDSIIISRDEIVNYEN